VHIGQVRREFDTGHEYETLNVAYDYELIATLGSNLGMSGSDAILELIDAVEEFGLDAVAGGICLAYATECFEKKLITEKETIVPLEFGNKENYLKAIKFMATKENEFYAALSDGVAVASQKYGGEEFAVSIAKNEMPAYHTGYGAIVGYSCGARHSHLCNGGYSYDQANHEFDKQALVDSVFDEEVKRCVLNSLIICLFARNVYDNATILSALDAVNAVEPGSLNDEYLEQLGLRIYKTKLKIKKALNFDLSKIQISKRVFATPAMKEILDENLTREMIEMFKKKNEELLTLDI